MKIGFLFIKWMFSKIFSKLLDFDNELRYNLRRKPGEAMFFWMILTVVFTLLNFVAMVAMTSMLGWNPGIWIALWLPAAMIAHFIIVSFQIMFKAFKDERAELFNTIKNS